ncbi:hypothetical protein H072_4905 [Dactylellina haptotyla CBS 200.50]|uniref:Uncharacterized protein n=1 Tax=Dactylellina haptotyla (strain CBS 200.50) TaxID=1284197 RepID=S8AJ84_DACHA|nr:hypothetical protein H072_4905 [Dactylellina haptotyla CBS 200.50]
MENYILFSWLILFFATFVGLYYTRQTWAAPMIRLFPFSIYNRLPESFTEDVEAGLTSESFNLVQNIDDEDSRAGLDAASKREILKIMKSKKMNFDQARTQFLTNKMAKNGIGPDGRPLDPRAVFFS